MRAGSQSPHSIVNTIRQTYGWLELGCPNEAAEELERLPDSLHSTREVLKLKCRILEASEDWKQLRMLSATSAMYHPQEPAFTENLAWAEHKQGRTGDAYWLLSQAAEKLPRTWRTAYFMSCFAYTLGRVGESSEWLRLAFILHSNPAELKQRALQEEDFSEVFDARYTSF